MASSTQPCKSLSCHHRPGAFRTTLMSSQQMRLSPSYISYNVNSDSSCGRRPPMMASTRLSGQTPGGPRDQGDGFDPRGVFLLVLCGLYALLMFAVARLLGYLLAKITAPVKSVFFSASVTEAYPVTVERKPSIEINNNSIEVLKVPRVHTRSLCHG